MRRLFSIFAAVSAVLWAAVVASWVAGHGGRDVWQTSYVGPLSDLDFRRTNWTVGSLDGTLTFQRSVDGLRLNKSHPDRVVRGRSWKHWRNSGETDGGWWSIRFGGRVFRSDGGWRGKSVSYSFIVPHWAVAASLAVPLVAGVAGRTRRRRPPGRCRRCGYDLRASPDRCPECGEFATIKPPTASAG